MTRRAGTSLLYNYSTSDSKFIAVPYSSATTKDACHSVWPNWSNFGSFWPISVQFLSKLGNYLGKCPFPARKFPGSHFPFFNKEMCHSTLDSKTVESENLSMKL